MTRCRRSDADWGKPMSEHGHGPAGKKVRTALKHKHLRPAASPADERADWIGQELRKVYDETTREAVPDRFTALLSKLREAEDEGSKS